MASMKGGRPCRNKKTKRFTDLFGKKKSLNGVDDEQTTVASDTNLKRVARSPSALARLGNMVLARARSRDRNCTLVDQSEAVCKFEALSKATKRLSSSFSNLLEKEAEKRDAKLVGPSRAGEMTSIERLKRWTSKLPSMKTKQQQQMRLIVDDSPNGETTKLHAVKPELPAGKQELPAGESKCQSHVKGNRSNMASDERRRKNNGLFFSRSLKDVMDANRRKNIVYSQKEPEKLFPDTEGESSPLDVDLCSFYEELDFKKPQDRREMSPVKLTSSKSEIEMSKIHRPSAFRPVAPSNNPIRCQDGPKTKKPPSPPPRAIHRQKRVTASDTTVPSGAITNSYYENSPLVIHNGFYRPLVINSSSVGSESWEYKKNLPTEPAVVSQPIRNDSQTRLPHVNSSLYNGNFSSSTADSGVSVQNYNSNYSSRNSSTGVSELGLTELEMSCNKEKESELDFVRSTMENNEQAIMQVYQEKEQQWRKKLKQFGQRVEQSVQAEQQLLCEIERMKDEQGGLERHVESLSADKRGLQRKCKELENELFTLKEQINEKRKHWEICRDCGKIFVAETQNINCTTNAICNSNSNCRKTSSVDETFSTKTATAADELRDEIELLKKEVSDVKTSLKEQIDNFCVERKMWEVEKGQVLQYHKALKDNYGWLINVDAINNNN